MRGLQVVVAFLVALGVMSLAFFGVWKYSMGQVTQNLPKILSETMPGQVKYSHVSTMFHPFNASIRLHNPSISMLDPKTGSTALVKLNDIVIYTEPFSAKKFQVIVPENISVVTTFQGRSTEYRLSFVDPTLEINKREGFYDLNFSMSGAVLTGREGGYFANLVKVSYTNFTKSNSDDQYSIAFNNLDLRDIAKYRSWPVLTSFNMVWDARGIEPFPLSYVLSAAGSTEKVAFDTMMMNYLKTVSIYSKINIIEGKLLVDDVWHSFMGQVGVDENLFLEINGALASNKFVSTIGGIKELMGGFPLALERMMHRVSAGENRTQSINLLSRKGILSINGAPVGQMPSAPELLNLHGRGARL